MKRRDFITASTVAWEFFLGMITWGVVTPALSGRLAQFLRPGTGMWLFRSLKVFLMVSSHGRS